MMGAAISDTWLALLTWFSDLGPFGLGLTLAGVVLAVVALVWLLRPRRGSGSGIRPAPEVLISQGEIVPRSRGDVMELRLSVSNLNAYPLQLLELAVRTEGSPIAFTTEVAALVVPEGVVDITAEFDGLDGDEGEVELYTYTTETRHKTHRVTARLLWEPWNHRYKVSPLEQWIEPVRALASTRDHRRQLEAWRRQANEAAAPVPAENPVLDDVFATVDYPDGTPLERLPVDPALRPKSKRERQEEEATPPAEPLDFPSEF